MAGQCEGDALGQGNVPLLLGGANTGIAATFGTVTHAIFPVAGQRDGNAEIVAASGMETLDIISRLQASDVDNATLDALRITTDQLCSEYPYLPSGQLAAEGRQWLKRVAGLQSQRLTLAQHREVLTLSGWLALLIGCVEYDMGDRAAAESTRKAALYRFLYLDQGGSLRSPRAAPAPAPGPDAPVSAPLRAPAPPATRLERAHLMPWTVALALFTGRGFWHRSWGVVAERHLDVRL